MSKITNYFKEVRAELKHVNWPTRAQTINYTLLVLGISLIVAALLGLFDALFSKLLQLIIS